MLLTLLGNLGMFGGNVPPPNPPFTPSYNETSGGGGMSYKSENELLLKKRNKRILEEEFEVMSICETFLKIYNN